MGLVSAQQRETRRRAQVLVALRNYGEPMTLAELEDGTGIPLFGVADVARGLFAEGLAYPQAFTPPTLALTTAPHVQANVQAAAELLGGQP